MYLNIYTKILRKIQQNMISQSSNQKDPSNHLNIGNFTSFKTPATHKIRKL